MSRPALRLLAIPFCPTAERVRLALALRGMDAALEGGRLAGCRPSVLTELVVERQGAEDVHLTDPLAMIELIEDLHPDRPLHPADPVIRASHRGLMAQGLVLQRHLDAVVTARQPADLDIAVYRLRAALAETERHMVPHIDAELPSNVDVVFASTLLRLRMLDLHVRAYLLSGFGTMTAWAERIARLPEVRSTASAEGMQLWLHHLAGSASVVVALQPDVMGRDSRPLVHRTETSRAHGFGR